MLRRVVWIFLTGALLLGCAATEGTKGEKQSRYIITAEEIAQSSASTAWEVVQFLRPDLLNRDQRRSIDMNQDGATAIAKVYMDNVRMGTKEDLKTIPASQIARIQYLNNREATNRFGSDHAGGAFLITSK